jgi:hypothetical protein
MLLYHQRGAALMAQVIDKKEAHDLIDQMTPEQIQAAIPLLRAMLPRLVEDEEISEPEKAAVAEADEWPKHNKQIPFEEVLADFGLIESTAACAPDRSRIL